MGVRFRSYGAGTSRVSFHDQARKVLIARFPGEHVVAERDGGELKIFMLVDETGMPAITTESQTTDAARMGMDGHSGARSALSSVAELQGANDALWRKRSA